MYNSGEIKLILQKISGSSVKAYYGTVTPYNLKVRKDII